MDYGHTVQPVIPPREGEPFFTTGAGTQSEDINTFESENNLDTTNLQAAWDTTPQRDPRSVGGSALNSINIANTLPAPGDFGSIPMPGDAQHDAHNRLMTEPTALIPKLGEIIELEPATPPTTPETPSTQDSTLPTPEIKTTEHLSDHGIKEIDAAISKLNQDGNIADFYDKARAMMEENLENSYNRKLAA